MYYHLAVDFRQVYALHYLPLVTATLFKFSQKARYFGEM